MMSQVLQWTQLLALICSRLPPAAALLRDHLVDGRGAEMPAGVVVLLAAAGLADRSVGDMQMRRLVLLVLGAGVEDVGHLVEGQRAVVARRLVRRRMRAELLGEPAHPLMPRLARQRVDETPAS